MDDFFKSLPKHEQHKTLSLHNCMRPCSSNLRNLWRTACDVTFYDSQIIYSVPAKALRDHFRLRCVGLVTKHFIKTYGVCETEVPQDMLLKHWLLQIFRGALPAPYTYPAALKDVQLGELVRLAFNDSLEISRCLEMGDCEDEISKMAMDVAVFARTKKWSRSADTRFYVD